MGGQASSDEAAAQKRAAPIFRTGRWLAVWLLLVAVFGAALAVCRLLTGQPLFDAADLVDLLLIPAAQVVALAALAATARQRLK